VDNPAPAAILPSVIGVVLDDGVVVVLELFFGFDFFGLSFVEEYVARSSCWCCCWWWCWCIRGKNDEWIVLLPVVVNAHTKHEVVATAIITNDAIVLAFRISRRSIVSN